MRWCCPWNAQRSPPAPGRECPQAPLRQLQNRECGSPSQGDLRHHGPLRQGKGVNAWGQVSQHALERVPGVGNAAQKEPRDTRWVSLLDVGNLNPVGNLNGLDNKCHVYDPAATRAVFAGWFVWPRVENSDRSTWSI
jgi:hypothetical protein